MKPEIIKSGSCSVKIYMTPKKGKNFWTLSYYNAEGTLKRPAFAVHEEAKEEARRIVRELASGRGSDIQVFRDQDRNVYNRALDILKDTGVTLDMAILNLAQALKHVDIHNLGEAARLYAQNRTASKVIKTVPEVVDELILSKQNAGRSFHYLKDLRIRLHRVTKVFQCPISSLTSEEIQRFLDSVKVSNRSKKNFRLTIGTLLAFARKRGYLDKDHPGITAVEKPTVEQAEIEIFTPEEIEKLLQHAPKELVPAIVIGCFAGLRSEEIRRLTWDEISLTESHIEITAKKAKLRTRRLVPISNNLKEWLLPFQNPGKPLCPYVNFSNQLLKLSRKVGIKWKRNGMRHSFISYRVALTGDVNRTSLEAGNSPAMIHANYLRAVTATKANAWFMIKSKKEGQCVHPPESSLPQ